MKSVKCHKRISNQCFHFIPPVRGEKIGTLARNGLIKTFKGNFFLRSIYRSGISGRSFYRSDICDRQIVSGRSSSEYGQCQYFRDFLDHSGQYGNTNFVHSLLTYNLLFLEAGFVLTVMQMIMEWYTYDVHFEGGVGGVRQKWGVIGRNGWGWG